MKYKLAVCFLFFTCLVSAQNLTMELGSGWQFRKAGDVEWLKATVPGTVHTDLLANKKIPDPFYRDNEAKVQWIEKEDWEYQSFFDTDNRTLSKMNIQLVFQGLDTYADVYLNGQHILSADNMFRSWSVEVKRLLRLKDNHLVVKFHAAQNRVDSIAKAALPFVLPDNPRVYVRKAQYHFGWDWGPKFTTCGIWKKITLEAWDELKIRDLHVREVKLDTLSDGNEMVTRASLTTEITIESATDKVYNILLAEAAGKRKTTATDTRGSNVFSEIFERIFVKKGVHTYTVVTVIFNPELWWPNGYGKPKTYRLSCAAFDGADTRTMPEDHKETSFAIRTVELVQQPDTVAATGPKHQDATGSAKSFYFRINGVPVFARGANFIPASPFLPSVSREDYAALIADAKAANMNMLRVWGGGIYESDDFYELCDQQGIMVWQDFMFACAMYPGDDHFMQNVKSELEENVKRLRDHPSIVLWCGNNENSEAWHNWGWQQQFNLHGADSARVWQWYSKLFGEIVPAVLADLDPSRPYWPSSPSYGWGRKESYLQGDSHYWGLWHGSREGYDIESVQQHTGRFVSEYGMQALPAWQTIEQFTLPEDRDTASQVMKAHQKNPPGYYKLGSYLDRYFRPAKDFAHYAYLTQCLQAYALKYSIQTHRSSIPWCMGTLFWQLNDCWPVTSWSTIDGNGSWKAAHYAVRDAYQPLLTGVEKEGKVYKVYLVNDGPAAKSQTIKATLTDFSGNAYWEKTVTVRIGPNSRQDILSVDSSVLFARVADTSSVMRLSVPDTASASDFVTVNLEYFARPNRLALEPARISLRQVDASHVEISSNVLARYVWLHIPVTSYHFSDNFFDLFPGEKKIVEVKTGRRIRKLAKAVRIWSVNDL